MANENYKKENSLGNDIVKFGSNGHFFDGNSEKLIKSGFSEGEEVTVKYNLKKGSISWSVGS